MLNPRYGVNYSSKMGWGKYCNRQCYYNSRKGVRVSPNTEFKRVYKIVDMVCVCGNTYKTTEGRLSSKRGKFCSNECKYIHSMLSGARHKMWKGDNVGYAALHDWVKRQLGKPMTCEFCGYKSTNSYKIHWANKSQEYKRDLDDWLRLCVKCHHEYDNLYERMWITRKGRINA